MLGGLLRLRPFQSDPNDAECAGRIARLEETVRKEDEDEMERRRNPCRNTSAPSGSTVRASSRSGISICSDDIAPHFDPPLIIRSNTAPAEGLEWGRWRNDGIPHPLHFVELFRLVFIGYFPLMNSGVPRWLLFLLNSAIYFPYTSSITVSSGSRNLMKLGELQAILWRDHRIGLCQRRELIIRRMGNRFLGGGFPHDFEVGFRESEPRLTNPVVLPTGILGRPIILPN